MRVTETQSWSALDVLAIQRAVAEFGLRDRCDWDGVADLFEPAAEIRLAWYRGGVDGFIESSRRAAESGAPNPKHTFGYPRVTGHGYRAAAETDVQITIRNDGDIPFDVTSWVVFIDHFVKVDERWKITRRTAIYERDRLDFLDPTRRFPLFSNGELHSRPGVTFLAVALERAGLPPPTHGVIAGSQDEVLTRSDAARWTGHHPQPRQSL